MNVIELMEKHDWLIFCERCLREVPEEQLEAFYLARDGQRGDGGVLVCVPWTFRSPYGKSERFLCDNCSTGVAVHRSSNWFVEKHREEHGGVKPV